MEFILSIIVIIIFLTMIEPNKYIYKRYYQVMVRHGPPWTIVWFVTCNTKLLFSPVLDMLGGYSFGCRGQIFMCECRQLLLVERTRNLRVLSLPSDSLVAVLFLVSDIRWRKSKLAIFKTSFINKTSLKIKLRFFSLLMFLTKKPTVPTFRSDKLRHHLVYGRVSTLSRFTSARFGDEFKDDHLIKPDEMFNVI